MNDEKSFFDVIKNRYSCRNFKNEKVDSSTLNTILESGLLAPTAVNKQPERIIVVNSDELINKMRMEFKGAFNARTILVVCYDSDVCWTRKNDGKCFGEVDSAIVATHMLLACEALDIGACYVCAFNENKLRELLNIPNKYKIHCMLPIGYKNEEKKEKSRVALNEIVSYR